MVRKAAFFAFSACLFVFCPASAQDWDSGQQHRIVNNDHFDHERFCVTIWPDETQVTESKGFSVKLRVVNSSSVLQVFKVMNCSWNMHWASNNSRICGTVWNCTRNFAVTIRLEPGEAYEQSWTMVVWNGRTGKQESFRMGFTPLGEEKAYWSNDVVVGVH
jgi:hypothetical protein